MCHEWLEQWREPLGPGRDGVGVAGGGGQQVTPPVRTKEQDDREMEEARRLQAKFDAEDKERAEREAADAK